MKKTSIVFLICLLGISALGFSAIKAKPKAQDKTEVICPVTMTKITPTTASDKIDYKGKTYYFCCAGCKPMFQKNPKKYIKQLQNMKTEPKHDMQGMKM